MQYFIPGYLSGFDTIWMVVNYLKQCLSVTINDYWYHNSIVYPQSMIESKIFSEPIHWLSLKVVRNIN